MLAAKKVSQLTINDLSRKVQFLGPDDEVIERVLRGVKSSRVLHGASGGYLLSLNDPESKNITLILTEEGASPNTISSKDLWEFSVPYDSLIVIVS